MKVTVFTSNQPRHISLIESLGAIADEVFAVQECNTVFPGEVEDFFRGSETMQAYFSHVMTAENEVFGRPRFIRNRGVTQLAIRPGDLNRLGLKGLRSALESDVYVVFGSSFIKGDLCDFLSENSALNIHVGTSPYYRGSSCNFWAMYDGNPDYVGATIHQLTKGLDSGPMLFHALPGPGTGDPFLLGMLAVKAAHEGLVHHLQSGEIWKMGTVDQDRGNELRYTRNSDFTDEVASEYLENLPSPDDVIAALTARDLSKFLNPFLA